MLANSATASRTRRTPSRTSVGDKGSAAFGRRSPCSAIRSSTTTKRSEAATAFRSRSAMPSKPAQRAADKALVACLTARSISGVGFENLAPDVTGAVYPPNRTKSTEYARFWLVRSPAWYKNSKWFNPSPIRFRTSYAPKRQRIMRFSTPCRESHNPSRPDELCSNPSKARLWWNPSTQGFHPHPMGRYYRQPASTPYKPTPPRWRGLRHDSNRMISRCDVG